MDWPQETEYERETSYLIVRWPIIQHQSQDQNEHQDSHPQSRIRHFWENEKLAQGREFWFLERPGPVPVYMWGWGWHPARSHPSWTAVKWLKDEWTPLKWPPFLWALRSILSPNHTWCLLLVGHGRVSRSSVGTKTTDSWGHLWIYLVHFLYPWDKETDAWERKGLLRPLVRARFGTRSPQSRTLPTASSCHRIQTV